MGGREGGAPAIHLPAARNPQPQRRDSPTLKGVNTVNTLEQRTLQSDTEFALCLLPTTAPGELLSFYLLTHSLMKLYYSSSVS